MDSQAESAEPGSTIIVLTMEQTCPCFKKKKETGMIENTAFINLRCAKTMSDLHGRPSIVFLTPIPKGGKDGAKGKDVGG